MSNIENLTFGVEIETTIPAGTMPVGAYHHGLWVTGTASGLLAPRFNGAMWKVEQDGSIRVDKAGHVKAEFVSPILKGEAGLRHLIEFVAFLRQIGAAVNSSCGLHVHVGAQGAAGGEDITAYIERLARLTAFNAKALYAQTGTISRERGQWCKQIGDRTRKAVAKAKRNKSINEVVNGDRYQLLNLTNLSTRNTVEFRCFAATLNTSKVLLHVFSALALCVIARKAKTPASWDNRPLTGEKALTNFLKVRPMTRIVSAPVFEEYFPRMVAKGLEMAGKYDLQQAAFDAIALTRGTATPR